MERLARTELQKIRDLALFEASQVTRLSIGSTTGYDQYYLLESAYKALAHAADRLDAMLSRGVELPVLDGAVEGSGGGGCCGGHVSRTGD